MQQRLLQLVNSGAALVGALLFYWGSRRSTTFAVQPLRALSAIAMVGACAVPNVVASYASYFLYILFFELVFFKIQADIVAACPAESMPLMATVQYAAVYTGMMLAILIGAFLVDKIGLAQAAVLFVLVYFLSDGFAQARLRKARPSL
jgi:CDP-diacylglycerol---serine O-phosphatidyltransferase